MIIYNLIKKTNKYCLMFSTKKVARLIELNTFLTRYLFIYLMFIGTIIVLVFFFLR